MFWRKANAAPRESETLRRAREQFGTGDAQSALGTLQQALTEQPEDRAAYAFAAELLAALGAEEEAALFQAATQSEPLQALFDLGMHFAEADQPLAEPFLQRAFDLSGHPVAALTLAEGKRRNFQIEAAAEEEEKNGAEAKGKIEWLLQGTLYPDVIESISFKGPSATIKTHHNVGGLLEDMKLKLIEPLRELFKGGSSVVPR